MRRLLLLGWLVGGCVHRPRPSDHLFGEPVTVMGHRGARGLAPENTTAAFAVAADLAVPFELDTMLCGSGELVVFHDETLERVTDGTGAVAEVPLSVLSGLDAGSHFSDAFAGEPIPTLAETLDRFGEQVLINIEVKGGQGAPAAEIASAVVAAVDAAGLSERVLVTSFNPFILAEIRAQRPEIMRGQIYGTFRGSGLKWYERVLLRNLAFNRKAVPDLLMMESAHATAGRIRRLHRKGYRVFVWTVNEEAEVRQMVSYGVDGIITDYPDQVQGWVSGR